MTAVRAMHLPRPSCRDCRAARRCSRAHAALYYAGLEEKRYPADRRLLDRDGSSGVKAGAGPGPRSPRSCSSTSRPTGLDPRYRARRTCSNLIVELAGAAQLPRSCCRTHLLPDVEAEFCDHAVIMASRSAAVSPVTIDELRGGAAAATRSWWSRSRPTPRGLGRRRSVRVPAGGNPARVDLAGGARGPNSAGPGDHRSWCFHRRAARRRAAGPRAPRRAAATASEAAFLRVHWRSGPCGWRAESTERPPLSGRPDPRFWATSATSGPGRAGRQPAWIVIMRHQPRGTAWKTWWRFKVLAGRGLRWRTAVGRRLPVPDQPAGLFPHARQA